MYGMYDLVSALGIFMVFIGFLYLVMYFVFSAAEYRILSIMHYKNSWFAWIPFLRYYAYGDVCSQTTGKISTLFGVDLPNWFMRFGWLGGTLLNIIPSVGYIFAIVWNVFYFGTICDFLYKRIDGMQNTALALVSGYFKIILVIKAFMWTKDIRLVSASTDVYPLGKPITGSFVDFGGRLYNGYDNNFNGNNQGYDGQSGNNFNGNNQGFNGQSGNGGVNLKK